MKQMTKICFLLWLSALLLVFAGTSVSATEGTATITKNMLTDNCIGSRAKKVKKRFKKAGFTNISYRKHATGIEGYDRLVFDLTIDGKRDFSVGDTYPSDAAVLISYWEFQEREATSTLASAPTFTSTPTPPPTPTPVPERTDPGTILLVQQSLNVLGYDCGTPDGVAGAMTRAAITAFQRDYGITQNGRITEEFILVYNAAVDKYNKAYAAQMSAGASTSYSTPSTPTRSTTYSSYSSPGSYSSPSSYSSYSSPGTYSSYSSPSSYSSYSSPGSYSSYSSPGSYDSYSSNDPYSLSSYGSGYVLNTNTMKFHYPSCSSVRDIAPYNRQDTYDSRESIIARGYVPCKRCNP